MPIPCNSNKIETAFVELVVDALSQSSQDHPMSIASVAYDMVETIFPHRLNTIITDFVDDLATSENEEKIRHGIKREFKLLVNFKPALSFERISDAIASSYTHTEGNIFNSKEISKEREEFLRAHSQGKTWEYKIIKAVYTIYERFWEDWEKSLHLFAKTIRKGSSVFHREFALLQVELQTIESFEDLFHSSYKERAVHFKQWVKKDKGPFYENGIWLKGLKQYSKALVQIIYDDYQSKLIVVKMETIARVVFDEFNLREIYKSWESLRRRGMDDRILKEMRLILKEHLKK